MKFLLDVNASGAVEDFLKERGHDVKSVRESDIRMADHEILQWAKNEARIIVTTDKDFESMIWLEGKSHSGLLRLENLPRNERIELLSSVIKKYSNYLEQGNIIIAQKNKIRIRH